MPRKACMERTNGAGRLAPNAVANHCLSSDDPGRCSPPIFWPAGPAFATFLAQSTVQMRVAAPVVILLLLVRGPASAQDSAAHGVGLGTAGAAAGLHEPDVAATLHLGVVGSSLGSRFPPPTDAPPAAPWTDLTNAPAVAVPPRSVEGLRLAAIGAASVGGAASALVHQRQYSWVNRVPRFRILNDWQYARWADKAGHFVVGAFLTRSYRSAFRWSGLAPVSARAWGAGAAWTVLLYSEVLDGFGSDWGFSPGDILFNTLGVAFATGQEMWPGLQAFEIRVGYWPTGEAHGRPVFEDYSGQTYWLAANLHRIDVAETGRWIPPWMGIAVGYAAREPGEYHFLTTSVVLVGLDIDLRGIPIRHPAWRTFVGIARYVRVPAPAVRLTQGVRFLPFAF